MPDSISAVIPVSPIKSHPETDILTTTVESIRHWLPDAEIFLTFDGVRPEQESRRKDYEEHIRRVLWQAKSWGKIVPYIFDDHQHQTGMLRNIIDDIGTPLMLYVEQDTPIVTDEPINWDTITEAINGGDFDMIRLHHEAIILDDHKHMMLGRIGDIEMTCQWSQRPHVASVAFYRRVLDCFTPKAKAFIEDRMHGVCHEAYARDGLAGWRGWRLGIYSPEGSSNIKRSYHLDARAGEPKWDAEQIF